MKVFSILNLHSVSRWCGMGTHPQDGRLIRNLTEKKRSKATCSHCSQLIHNHGFLNTGGDGQVICPGDYILEDMSGNYFVVSATSFHGLFRQLIESNDPAALRANARGLQIDQPLTLDAYGDDR